VGVGAADEMGDEAAPEETGDARLVPLGVDEAADDDTGDTTPVPLGRGMTSVLVAWARAELVAIGTVVLVGVVLFDAVPRARIFAAAASAATMTMACVFPVGRSGCIEASTTKRLSVP